MSYFVLAYVLTWALVLPIVISQRGIGWISVPEPLLLVFFIASTYIGPLPAAFILTALLDGRRGIRALLGRIVQWRIGVGWYALVLVAYPVFFLLALSIVLGLAPLNGLLQNWPLLFSAYLPSIAFGMVFPGLGEEPGWRGFALPRLYGPLVGSLILGALHALWHTPAYFVPGAILDKFDLGLFLGNSVLITVITVIWTWLFNNATGSVFFAMFVHATGNATAQFVQPAAAERRRRDRRSAR